MTRITNRKAVDRDAAKAQLANLVDKVAAGGKVVIAKAGRPAARLVSLARSMGYRKLGVLKRKLKVPVDFDAPLPVTVLAAFGR
jgi:prevent-host-death family protein